MIGPRPILVEPECFVILAAGEQEAVIVGGAGNRLPGLIVEGGFAEGVVAIFLDHAHGAAVVGQVSDVTVAILLASIPMPCIVRAICAAEDQFVDAFAI